MEERSYSANLEEKSYTAPALIGSLTFHGILLIAFLFMFFGLPDPPLAEMGGSGVELNFGTSDAGSGDVQTYNQPNPSKEEVQSTPAEQVQQPEPQQEEQKEAPVQQTSEKLLEEEDGPAVDIKQKDKNQEKKETEKNKLKNEKTTQASTSANKNTNTDNNKANGTVATMDSRAVMGGNNNGDKNGAVGDQGNPKGSLDAKALYGNAGTGGDGPGGSGGGVNLPGWEVEISKDQDPSDEEGKVVFEFEVDPDGNIISIKKIAGNLSPSTDRFYKKQLEMAEFTPIDKRLVKPRNRGTYTYIVKKR